jgi:TonB family protein
LLALVLVGATPAPLPPAPSPAATTWCPITPVLVPLDDTHLALGFSTPFPAGRASGVVTLWTADARYDVRFVDAVVLHYGRVTAGIPDPVPIVLRFPAPVRIESAVVTSLDAPTPGPCDPPYVPWRSGGPIAIGTETQVAAYRQKAEEAVARDAPQPAPYTPPQCPVRFAPPKTVRTFAPRAMRYNGIVDVLVTVGTDGQALSVETLRSSGFSAVDAVAKDAAVRARYQAEIFDCRKIVGTYLFSVEFSFP